MTSPPRQKGLRSGSARTFCKRWYFKDLRLIDMRQLIRKFLLERHL
jgi:hypothetical protein